MENDYNRKTERHENLQTEYREKNERRNSITEQKISHTATSFLETVSSVPASPAVLTALPSSNFTTLSVVSESPDRPSVSLLQESSSVPVTPGTVSPSFLLAGSNPISITPSSTAQPAVQPVTVSSGPVTALDAVSVMTIFTASGRFRINKEETEEKNEPEKKKEKEKGKEKKGIISLFGQGFTGITQPVAYKNYSNYSLPDTETEYDTKHNTKTELNNDSQYIVQKTADATGREWEQKLELESESKLEQESKPDANRTKLTPENWFHEEQTVEHSSIQPNEPESSDQLRFIQRVAAACQSAANQHGTVRIKLHLDKLGTLTLRITAKSNKLSVRFEVTSSAAARLIRNNIDKLQTTLTEQNIILEHTEIDMI